MNRSSQQNLTAIYDTYYGPEAAVNRLSKAKFKMKDCTVFGMDYLPKEHPTGFVDTGTKLKVYGTCGAFSGCLWGLMFGSAIFFVPDVGFPIFAGWLVSKIIGAAEGEILGGATGAKSAALLNAGNPEEAIIKYESDIRDGKCLIIGIGDQRILEMARKGLGINAEASVAS